MPFRYGLDRNNFQKSPEIGKSPFGPLWVPLAPWPPSPGPLGPLGSLGGLGWGWGPWGAFGSKGSAPCRSEKRASRKLGGGADSAGENILGRRHARKRIWILSAQNPPGGPSCTQNEIYDIGTKIIYETCFATKMLLKTPCGVSPHAPVIWSSAICTPSWQVVHGGLCTEFF